MLTIVHEWRAGQMANLVNYPLACKAMSYPHVTSSSRRRPATAAAAAL